MKTGEVSSDMVGSSGVKCPYILEYICQAGQRMPEIDRLQNGGRDSSRRDKSKPEETTEEPVADPMGEPEVVYQFRRVCQNQSRATSTARRYWRC